MQARPAPAKQRPPCAEAETCAVMEAFPAARCLSTRGTDLALPFFGDASASTPPQLRWFWSIIEVIRVPGGVMHGHAPTLDEAKAKFRDNWTRAKAGG